jgi:hypothetical protein
MEKIYDEFKELENDEDMKRYFEFGGTAVTLGRIRFKNQYDPKFDGVDVDLEFKDDKRERGSYRSSNKTVYINFNSDVGKDKTFFMNTLYHELVHAIDPKVNDYKVSTSLNKNLDAKNAIDKSSADYTKYIKDPAEFDAFSSSFVNKIKDELEILQDPFKQLAKDDLKDLINGLLGILKSNPNANLDINQKLFDDFYSKYWYQIATIRNLLFDSSFDTIGKFLVNILEYLNKPSLYKKYIQRLSTVL